MLRCAAIGSRRYYAWIAFLSLGVLTGALVFLHDLLEGLGGTNMTDHVSWGIGIANFVYFVGVAAGAAILVVPSYAYVREDIKEVVLLGELLAVSAVTVCLLFIATDIGRPERMWHLMPPLGILNLPSSLLAWDVVVFSGYLAMNLHIPGYLLYKKYLGEKPSWRAYMPFVFLSMAWAVSIHTVTAFLLSGMGSRAFWNTPILAPRFLISAGASGPAILIFVFKAIDRHTNLKVKDSVFEYFKYVLRVMMPINLFLLGCEFFWEFYTGSAHAISAQYLYFGVDGHASLVLWIWPAIIFNIVATAIFLIPRMRDDPRLLYTACLLTIMGIWIEKGMGLVFPGFIPNAWGEFFEYTPSLEELVLNAGVMAFGALLFTVMAKVNIAIQVGELRKEPD